MPMNNGLVELIETVSSWSGVVCSSGRFDSVVFHVAGRGIGHVHEDGSVEMPLPPLVREALIRAAKVTVHPWVPNSDWVAIQAKPSIKPALELLRFSYLRLRSKDRDLTIAAEAKQELSHHAVTLQTFFEDEDRIGDTWKQLNAPATR